MSSKQKSNYDNYKSRRKNSRSRSKELNNRDNFRSRDRSEKYENQKGI